MEPISIYIHIPFCKHRCGYCDFNTYAGIENLIPAYVDALIKEIDHFAQQAPNKMFAHTIFFGGGTPSLLDPSQLEKILDAVIDNFEILNGPEISLEANPGTLDQDKLNEYFSLGLNRLSLGVQSTLSPELRMLERTHEYSDAVEAVKYARNAGFDNLSLDLIFGLPDQKLSHWQENLLVASSLNPEHISLYALTIEKGTPIERQILKGNLPNPNDDLAADMYEWTMDYLAQKGYIHYEISNWAQVDKKGNTQLSKHNLQYWKNDPYVGFGAGAHSFMGGYRYSNILAPSAYIGAMNQEKGANFPFTPASMQIQEISEEIEMGETMMMGLRLLELGVSRTEFLERFNQDLEVKFATEISQLLSNDLLAWQGENIDRLVLTKKGRLLGNQVFMKFL